ncbi:glycosyltransferase [Microbacterium aurantiacum]|uniref:Glycosyltransferase n=1 Tax=Microbacterium aurantiacum TaxID=162393 RepID=A0ABT8FUZ7_9MICO|nr:glycosyltransferase [Microbacterium aurantiacum]MDN4465133.1 glycosyltransferase [Microbacterium aurantiacum]
MSDVEMPALSKWDIIVVTFNSATVLAEVWSGVPDEVRARVVCVDNSSSDDTLSVARTLFPRVLSSPNMGLSVANNLGTSDGASPYVLFANPDVAPQAADFERLSRHLDEHGGLVSPRLIHEDGTPQENARGWPVLLAQITNRLSDRRSNAYRWPLKVGVDGPVPWILGAAVAVRRVDLERISGWPEEYFLYYEDVELSMRAWDSGMPVWLLGSIEWHHKWARSSRSYLHKSTRLHARSAGRFFLTRPGFVWKAPRSLFSQYSERLKASSPQQGLRAIDLVVRSDAAVKHGGDLVQAERYCRELTKLGLDVRVVPFRLDYAPEPATLVHFFNIDRPYEFLFASKSLELDNVVVSTIHHSASLTRLMRQAEARSSGLDSLAARLPGRLREAALFALRSMTAQEVRPLRRVKAAAWAVGKGAFSNRSEIGRALDRCRAVFVLSRRELEDLKRDTSYHGLNSVLVPNGLEVATRGGVDWAARAPRILVVGRIEPRKRQVEIVETANRLDIALTFVGAANSKRDGYVRQFRDALSLGPSEWVGALAHDEVLDLMGQSRVLLNLSWLEVQSLVDLEGAAMGCRLIVSAAGSTREWLGEAVEEFPVGEIAEPLLAASKRAQDSTAAPVMNYSQTWESAARQLVEAYNRVGPSSTSRATEVRLGLEVDESSEPGTAGPRQVGRV